MYTSVGVRIFALLFIGPERTTIDYTKAESMCQGHRNLARICTLLDEAELHLADGTMSSYWSF